MIEQTRYLKKEQYYSELYDRATINQCKNWEKRSEPKEEEKDSQILKLTGNIALYFIKGYRYKNRAETIRAWMKADQDKNTKVANAVEPVGIRCLKCSSFMDCILRDLNTYDGKIERVLFFFQCPKCKKRGAYWEGGQEWEYEGARCPNCQSAMEHADERKGNIITTIFTCRDCGYNKTEQMDLSVKESIIDPNFEADRKKYCLSEKEGLAYIDSEDSINNLAKMTKDREENKEIIEAVAKLKCLTVAGLEKILNPLIVKAGYTKFTFEKPKIEKDVIVEFSAQDDKPGRPEYDSINDLRKIIQKMLKSTNWRLMSAGISYRLGFLNGRLRGVEGEENLRALVASKIKKRDTFKTPL